MLQSWGDVIRVFPAWPAAWGDAVFHELRGEGGFRVSAAHQDGRVAWVAVSTEAGGRLRMRVDLPTFTAHGIEADAITHSGGTLVVDLPADGHVLLTASGVTPTMAIAPVPMQPGRDNTFGLNERFLAPRRGRERPERLAGRGQGLVPW
jgi:hypothetical protein